MMHPAQSRIFQDLNHRQYFKLICGGSFSDTARLSQLITCYAQLGISAIDVSASRSVVDAAIECMASMPNPPLLMVSFPLDADPHFRKIELDTSQCIDCGLCIPVCPTQVFHLPDTQSLMVNTPACYGCGRCVPACPTDALHLDPFSVFPDLEYVLQQPDVTAVELHTTYADPIMLDALEMSIGPLLRNKLISVCFRPQTLPQKQVLHFLNRLQVMTDLPLLLQIDGAPMSGNNSPEASIPALTAAKDFQIYAPTHMPVTISGGINAHTADYLQKSEYEFIRGIGMGTYARQLVWDYLDQPAKAAHLADSLIKCFQHLPISAIL